MIRKIVLLFKPVLQKSSNFQSTLVEPNFCKLRVQAYHKATNPHQLNYVRTIPQPARFGSHVKPLVQQFQLVA